MYKYYLIILLQCIVLTAMAQENSHTSRVVDAQNNAVPGVNVLILETQGYAITDNQGVFHLTTELDSFSIELSSIGFKTKQIEISGGNIPDEIKITKAATGLNEVVVTALGIERDKHSLGSSVSTVGTEQLSAVPQTNIVNSLSGAVAGVQTTNGSSGVGSSSRIIIRGENSLSSTNQPLFVVDGIPIRNRQIGSELFNDGNFAEVDFGNGAADISPGDIASLTILKGPGSAALYGSRAANGVVLINTKDGRNTEGLGISTSSTLTFSSPLTMPDYQNTYGGGSNGQYSFQDGVGGGINDGGIASYGPKLDQGKMINQFDSPSVDIEGNPVRAGDVYARTFSDGSLTEITPTPWISHPDNVRNFFETGVSSQNNIALSGATDKTSFRTSYGNLRHKGMLPNTGLDRDGITFSLNHKISNNLDIDLFANYINSRSKNRPNLGYGYENVMYGFNWTGRQADIQSMRDYWQAGQEGVQHYGINYKWLTNPYLTLYENTNSFNKNRLLGNGTINYAITDHLGVRLRSGVDIFDEKRIFKRAYSTNAKPFGGYREDYIGYREINTDILFSYKNRINSRWKYEVSAGGNRFDQEITYKYVVANELNIPGEYNLANSGVALQGTNDLYRKRINSIYGIGNLSFRKMYYLNLTARNDWSSTLPVNNNDYAYYSASLSFVFSKYVDLPDFISYGKLRLSAASVGNDTDPYQLNNTFSFNQSYADFFRVSNNEVIKNANLKPERLNAYEVGVETWYFKDRFQIDVSAYQNTSINQIIGRPISNSTGFTNVIKNGGVVRTRGLEAMLSIRIMNINNFKWKTSVNYSTYRSIVKHLPKGVTQYVTGEAKIFSGGGGSNTVFYNAKEGGRVGDMYGTGFVEINGKTLYGSNGLPVQSNELRLLGNYNPDFMLGLNNEIQLNNFTLSFLFDWRQGGTIVSRQKALGSTSGVLKETLRGREKGIVGDGVMNIGNAENPEYVPNTTKVTASQFYNNYYDRGNEESALYDASYVKLRQASIYYSFPEKFVNSIGFQELQIGIIGSNLLLFTENPHFDPELNMLEGPVQTFGVEDMSYPSARSYGFSLKTKF